jgi:hypothetical protein
MNENQENHLESIKKEFNKLVDPKYRKGVQEHGGNLWQMDRESLLNCAIEEAIDQVVYLITLRQQLYDYK